MKLVVKPIIKMPKLISKGPLSPQMNGVGTIGGKTVGTGSAGHARAASTVGGFRGDRSRRRRSNIESVGVKYIKSPEQLKQEKEEAERIRKAKEAARAETKKVFTTDIENKGRQAEARQMQQEAINRIRSGETGRRSREDALAGLVASQTLGGPGAKKMLQQQASGISRKAGAEALGATKDVVGMGGKMRMQDIGVAKADKTARMKHEQLLLGEKLAREGMKAQVDAARAGARSCFAAETKISTPSGQVYIKDIKIGDEVLSFDDEGQISVNVVTKVFEHEPGDIYKLSYWGGEVLITTNHWILEANNTFLQADKFNTDHCLVDEEGNFRPFKSLEFYELDKTYNITVENDHTYIANGIRVHNIGGGKAGGGEIFKKYAKGGSYPRKNGKIKGPGTETSDSIKARLSDGEFVVNAKTVRGIGEALGAKGKQPSRQKGSAYLYALQSKYGDTKAKDPKGLIPGYFGGAEVAKVAQQAAASGLLGEGAQKVGKVAGAGMEAHEKGIKAKEAKAKKAADEAFRKKQIAYYDKQLEKGKPSSTPAKEAPGPEDVGRRETKSIMAKSAAPAPSPEAVGIRETKSIMKKPEDIGLKYSSISDKKYQQAVERNKRAVEGKKMGLEGKEIARYAKKEGEYGRGMKDGGKVSKDHPHYKFLKDLDDWQEKRNRRGKIVDLDPGRKADKAIKAKKGSVEPVKMKGGGSSFMAQGARLKQMIAEGAKSGSEPGGKGIIPGIGEAIKKWKSGPSSDERMKKIQDEVHSDMYDEKPAKLKAGKFIKAKKGSIEPMKFQTGDLVEKEIKSKEGKLALDLQNPNSKLSKLIQKARQGRLDKADLEAAKELGYKPSMSKKIGTGVDYNPLSGLVKWIKGLTSPKKKVDVKALLKKQQEEKDFKQKAGDKEILSKFRRDLEREKKAGGGHGRETGLKIKQLKKEEEQADFFRKWKKGKDKERKVKEAAMDPFEKLGMDPFDFKSKHDVRKKLKSQGEDPKLIKEAQEYHNKYIKDVSKRVPKGSRDSFTEKGHMDFKIDKGLRNLDELIKKPMREAQKKREKELKKMWKHEGDKKLSPVKVGTGKEDVEMRDLSGDKELERSLKDPKARAFLLKQGKIPHEDMTIKERFADRARKRAKQDDKEAKDYEKKAGFFDKLGDRFSTGEWFGSSKDILAAKRRAKDKEQAKREKSGEDFEAKKAAQDKKILKGKLDKIKEPMGPSIYERKKAKIEAPKPKVAPKVEAPKTKTPEVKEVKKKKGEMTSKDWADVGVAAGTSLIGSIAAAKKAKADRRRAREAELRKARQSAGKSLSEFGRGVMSMDTRLKKGGRVSFKDVLKAKKKMGY